ncbi:fructosamine kinase family protein [Gilvimarinus sp. F26214L]|uniref:fructosamine kinase family protein n=1 Tax=Gilvimarinus sp. DZF01 TaxID=3461371 RepID=UPI0040452120
MNNVMPLPPKLINWLQSAGYSSPFNLQPLIGGDINDTFALSTACGHRFCLKHNTRAPDDFFAAEAHGLKTLASAGALRLPDVIHLEENYILLEFIESGPRAPGYWADLGGGLARLHKQVRPQFGFERDNYCGLTPQVNTPSADGYEFFAQHRLMAQARRAFEKGLLGRQEMVLAERLASRLGNLVPEQKPALLHGDLWSGNIHRDSAGRPVLIDPAAYCGWPEADLAMTLLFGGFNEEFYSAYEAERPLAPGWRQRAPIYNLYHLINHLNLFGGGYHGQVLAVLRRYT